MFVNQGRGELTTTFTDGRIRSVDTIAPGNDPVPPKDKEHRTNLTIRLNQIQRNWTATMTDLRWVAVHEAGHAVAQLRLFPDQYFEHISIEAEEDSLGRVRLSFDTTVVPKSLNDQEAEDVFLNDAIAACAGYAACVVAGFSEEQALTGCESDFERAGHRKELACELALELLGREENIRAVGLIADKLLELKTIDHDHIGVLMEFADDECSEEEYREYLEFRTIG